MKILSLGFEDHTKPGAGGGSMRNHQVNSRLVSMGHEVHVVTARYRGARRRVEDGVNYRHIGAPIGYRPGILAYQAALLPATIALTKRLAPDLLVEEFAPPWSSLGVGHWTDLPSVGLAHGYFAREKAEQYHLSVRALTAIQRWGTRSHPYLITNSEDVLHQLEEVSPQSQTFVCSTGLDQALIASTLGDEDATLAGSQPGHLLFLGRLELHQKGLDLLIDALGRLTSAGWRLTVAGEGSEGELMRRQVAATPWAHRVTFVGPVTGADKWRLLGSASVVAMPSRYETYGTVALESMAAGTPVVHFSIPSLRDTVPAACGVSVAPWDTAAFAAGIDALLSDPARWRSAAAGGIAYARTQTWDLAALEHERIYLGAADRQSVQKIDTHHPALA